MPSTVHEEDIEMQVTTNGPLTVPLTVHKAEIQLRSPLESAGQSCFICLTTNRDGDFAVQVPCLRPTKPRRVTRTIRRLGEDLKLKYEKIQPWDSSCESDVPIWQRLVDTCFQHHGTWKRWLPFYGITKVYEVDFNFTGLATSHGRYPISFKVPNLEKMKAELSETVARYTPDTMFDMEYMCDGYAHSSDCLNDMEYRNQKCQLETAEDAKKRLKHLDLRGNLKFCAMDPNIANGIRSLDGYVQDTCVYDVNGPEQVITPQSYDEFLKTTTKRGLRFEMGWQTDRMAVEMPFQAAIIWFGLAIIWLCVLLGKAEQGDWQIALGLAQVVAASITFVVTLVRR